MTTYYPNFIKTWYKEDYITETEKYFNDTSKKYKVNCMIVPHAGYKYSGLVLGETYSKIDWTNINKIFLLCTLHNSDNFVYLPNFINVQYPDHSININTNIVNQLAKNKLFTTDLDNSVFNKEHSFEIQLPFILSSSSNKSDLTLIPLLVGNTKNFNEIAKLLTYYMDHNTLIIVSSDFTHFGKNYNYIPQTSNIKKFILNKDMMDFYKLINNDIKYFIEKKHDLSICGINPILLWMHLLNNLSYKLHSKLVAYNTSGDYLYETHNYSSVSYAGILYTQKEYDKPNTDISKIYQFKKIKLEIDNKINNGEKIDLNKLCNGNISLIPRITMILFDKLNFYDYDEKNMLQIYKNFILPLEINTKGVFVTFEDNDKLQGCLGIFNEEANKMGLHQYELIILYTLRTIFNDNRFIDNILRNKKGYQYLFTSTRFNFKINLLEENIKIDADNFWNTYIPCKHGIVLHHLNRSATFLPMVMKEQGWLKTCNKSEMTNEDRLYFEQETFGNLLGKMGYLNFNSIWLEWKNKENSQIFLYEGDEITETVSSDIIKF